MYENWQIRILESLEDIIPLNEGDLDMKLEDDSNITLEEVEELEQELTEALDKVKKVKLKFK